MLHFRTGLIETLAMAACVALFVHLGNWQYGKAEAQTASQAQLEQRAHDAAVLLANAMLDPERDTFRTVVARGEYLPGLQILLDNQLSGGRAGYHVLTPFRLAGTRELIYVNRGWVAADPDRSRLPDVAPPPGTLEIKGELVRPPKPRWLAAPPADAPGQAWPAVWQAVDMAAIEARVGERVAPLLLLLDPALPGGYDRARPRLDSRVGMHRSYAYQWYGLSILAVLLYLLAGWRRGRMRDDGGASP